METTNDVRGGNPRRQGRGKQKTVCRLHRDIMYAAPSGNYGLWDESEVHELESYARQFKTAEPEGYRSDNFMKNWAAVMTAIDYFYGTLATTYVPFEDLPLKQAIKSGKTFKNTKNLLLSHDSYGALKRFSEGRHVDPRALDFVRKEVLARIPMGKCVRMTAPEYFLLESDDSYDERARNCVQKNPQLISLVAVRRDLSGVPEMTPARRSNFQLLPDTDIDKRNSKPQTKTSK